MSGVLSIEHRAREMALAARKAADLLAAAMNEAHAAGVNFEVAVQFSSSGWEVKLTPFTRSIINLDN